MMAPAATVENLTKVFRLPQKSGGDVKTITAVDGVSFSIGSGQTFGLVGESGAGKSTVGRMVAGLTEPTAGRIALFGQDVAGARLRSQNPARRKLQFIFQDPFSSLNPRMRIGESVAEPLRPAGVSRSERQERVRELLRQVGLPADCGFRYPHEFSGGQRQRIAIARALTTDPGLIVCDEPVSALDVSIQAQILNLLRDLQEKLGIAYLFVSHDLAVVRYISDVIGVMYAGRLVETAPRSRFYAGPRHPYSRLLLDSVPQFRKRADEPATDPLPPTVSAPASGCVFVARCPVATTRCANEAPKLDERAPGHLVACHLAD